MEFNDFLSIAFKEIQGSSAWSMERIRPYDGQPHTFNGIRGKIQIEGLSMRDVADCIVRALLTSGEAAKRENPIHDDVYSIKKIDPIAIVQMTLVNIEKMMGIYPNISKLHFEPGGEG